jgi:hypothetical protein
MLEESVKVIITVSLPICCNESIPFSSEVDASAFEVVPLYAKAPTGNVITIIRKMDRVFINILFSPVKMKFTFLYRFLFYSQCIKV